MCGEERRGWIAMGRKGKVDMGTKKTSSKTRRRFNDTILYDTRGRGERRKGVEKRRSNAKQTKKGR